MHLDMNVTNEQMRVLVLEFLKHERSESYTPHQQSDLVTHIGTLAVKLGMVKATPKAGFSGPKRTMYGVEEEYLDQRDVSRATNVLWDLIVEGIVRPGTGDGRAYDFPNIHLTEYGRQKLKDARTPYDPDSYLTRLKADIPKLDQTILVYLDECLKVFRVGCTRSAAICLGVASEKAFILVIDSYTDYLGEPDRMTFRKKIDGQSINQQFEAFKNKYEGSLKTSLPREVKENLATSLYGIFNLIRNQRNDAGHPTGEPLDRENVYASIVAFPNQLKHMFGLIDWLVKNQQT